MYQDTRTKQLIASWRDAKHAEQRAKITRISIEERLVKQIGMDTNRAGAKSVHGVRVQCGLSSKVDHEALVDAAKQNGIDKKRLGELFRWKPEIDAKAWAKATPEEKAALSVAITEKPKKPSFTALKKEEQEENE